MNNKCDMICVNIGFPKFANNDKLHLFITNPVTGEIRSRSFLQEEFLEKLLYTRKHWYICKDYIRITSLYFDEKLKKLKVIYNIPVNKSNNLPDLFELKFILNRLFGRRKWYKEEFGHENLEIDWKD